jgi:ferredoxin-NADP reductase/predicted pyridoxine 5'-phosphate oxidase superfamily flavin-nucleotide-binding protein
MVVATATTSTNKYYPIDWPYEMPFHKGEVALQHQAGPNIHESVMSYAPKVIRPYMPDQHRAFYQDLPFIVVAARDGEDNLWATLLMNPKVIDSKNNNKTSNDVRAAVASPDPVTLQLPARLVSGDALDTSAWGRPGMDLGLLGIDFSTARRNRVNGWVNRDDSDSKFLSMHVTQSFGNCPQYIPSRQWWTPNPTTTTANLTDDRKKEDASTASSFASPLRSKSLRPEQIQLLEQAETILVATGYRGGDGIDGDVRYGNDASHPAGFLQVSPDGTTITMPEFKGNNHFNSLGNLLMDKRMGITVPLLEEGGLLQLTGTAVVDMDTERAAALFPGALRIVTFTVAQVNQVPAGTLPIRWDLELASQQRDLRVVAKVPESTNVTSFYFEPTEFSPTSSAEKEPLWDFVPGQHLPIRLVTAAGELQRTYSLSAAPTAQANRYRISVKREPQGKASRFLHDQLQVGDIIQVRKPAGDFVLLEPDRNSKNIADDHPRTVVLLSTGVGVTPLLSMLHHLVALYGDAKAQAGSLEQSASNHDPQIVWIHGARDGAHHAFRDEVDDLDMTSLGCPALLKRHIAYSQPTAQDTGLYDSKGRIDAKLVQELVPDLSHADFYLCGPGAFMANLTEGLENVGVDPKYIYFETF